MNIFKKIKLANKLLKIYQEVTSYLDKTHLTDDIKRDIEIIKEAAQRLSAKIPVIKELLDLIF